MILILIVAGVVLAVGFLPFRLDPGTYAVLVTKTGGVDDCVVAPGSWRWSAAALLPTNVRLVRFAPRVIERSVEATGELPSAAAYSAFMAGNPDFGYSVSARLSAAVKAEALPELYGRWGVDGDAALEAWLQGELELAASELRGALMAAGERGVIDESVLAQEVAARHESLDLRGLRIIASRLPDLSLYDEARRVYSAYVERYRAAVEPALAAASAESAADQVRIDSLRRYGELLGQYPALVDYLAIEAGLPPRQPRGE